MNRQMGRVKPGSSSDGDAGKSGWRTYAQAKNSEAFFKRKRQTSTASNSKGYRQNSAYQQQNLNQQRERTPKPENSSDDKGPSSSSTGGSTDDKDIEVIAHVRRNSDWNQRQRVVKTGPPYDPYHPIALAPPPPQHQIAKMYEEMLYNAAVENSTSTATTAKGLRTVGVGDHGRFAEEHSSGYFVKTNSKYGNSVMPVLPRL